MKNATILKDELGLLRADKSAVVTELRKGSQELKDILIDISKAETKRERVKGKILVETARLDEVRVRAVSVNSELVVSTQDLKNMLNANEVSKVKNSQEQRLHLGRIKELEETEAETIKEISRLRSIFDKNSKVYNESESNRQTKIRDLDTKIKAKESKLDKASKELEKIEGEEKKMTKDRLRREDKIRHREKVLDANEFALTKKEEDLITMSKDMSIVYSRIKELYAKVDPNIDLDKLILQAI